MNDKNIKNIINNNYNIYLTQTLWWNWWYGGCFGSRPMIDITPLLALPIAALLLQAQTHWHKYAKTTLYMVVGLLIMLNIFQSYQYSIGAIHYEKMTAKYYFNMFFATQPPTPEEEKLLMSSKTYYGKMAHRYNQVKDK